MEAYWPHGRCMAGSFARGGREGKPPRRSCRFDRKWLTCGISGAIQHQAGMSSARVIVAINNNPNAPIFKLATYGIVGDLFEVIPLLTEEVKRLKAGG